MLRTLFLLLFLSMPFSLLAGGGKVVEVNVEGMTCPFCSQGVQGMLKEIPGVEGVQVSLELKKARIHFKENSQPDMAAIKKAVEKAGFRPGTPTVVKGE